MSDLIYLYGFVPRDSARPSSGLRGIAGSLVEIVDCGAISAAISRVDAEPYSAEALNARMQDLPWVAEQGVNHERAVAWFVDHGDILPVPLFTLYSRLSALQESVRDREHELHAALERLSGKFEWDVKYTFDRDKLTHRLSEFSDDVSAIDQEIATSGPGRSFLLNRKRADIVKSALSQTARQLAVASIARLKPLAVDSRDIDVMRRTGDQPVAANAALLVVREAADEFVAALNAEAATLADAGIDLTFSGPWAPYRFLSDERL